MLELALVKNESPFLRVLDSCHNQPADIIIWLGHATLHAGDNEITSMLYLMTMPGILDTSCSRKTLTSTAEQQDGDGGEDGGILSSDTSIMSHPAYGTRQRDGVTSHESLS